MCNILSAWNGHIVTLCCSDVLSVSWAESIKQFSFHSLRVDQQRVNNYLSFKFLFHFLLCLVRPFGSSLLRTLSLLLETLFRTEYWLTYWIKYRCKWNRYVVCDCFSIRKLTTVTIWSEKVTNRQVLIKYRQNWLKQG